MNAVDAGLDQTTRQGRQGVAGVDGDGTILWASTHIKTCKVREVTM